MGSVSYSPPAPFFGVLPRYIAIPFSGTILTAGTPADLGVVPIPSYVTQWTPDKVIVNTLSAAGTLAATTVDMRTAQNGGGTSLFSAPIALSSLTTAGTVQNLSVAAAASIFGSTGIAVRQTINSLNAGTAMFTLFINDLT